MTELSASANAHGEGVAGLPRELRGAILAALDCDDRAIRQKVWAGVNAIGMPSWDEDLNTLGALIEHLHTIGASSRADAERVATIIPLRWALTRPFIPPQDAG